MPAPESSEAWLSRALHAKFDDIVATDALRTRIQDVLEQQRATSNQNSLATAITRTRPDPPPLSRFKWVVPVAVAVATLAVLVSVVSIQKNAADRPSSALGPSSATALTPSSSAPLTPEQACADPRSDFARFWVLMEGPDGDKVYQRKVTIGGSTLPSMAIYAGGAPAGEGLLCASDVANPPGLRASLEPRAGQIGYAGHDSEGIVWGAVRPGVTRVVIDQPPNSWTITADGTRETQLQSLGNGWHAFTTGAAQGNTATFTITAYDASNNKLDSITIDDDVTSVQPSASTPGG